MGLQDTDAIKNIQTEIVSIGKSLVALGKLEVQQAAKRLGVGVGLLAAAAFLALFAISLLLTGGAVAFYALLDDTATWRLPVGFVIMGVIVLVVVAILALIGASSIRRASGPQATIEEGRATADAVKSAVDHGREEARLHLEHPETAPENIALESRGR